MGLKTTNYHINKLGLTMNDAYAMIKRMLVNDMNVHVVFAVQSSRTSAQTLQPLEEKELYFTLPSRNCNPFEEAYIAAKKMITVDVWNEEKLAYESVEKPNIFTGWEDDIQK